jgi:hypothetical protein
VTFSKVGNSKKILLNFFYFGFLFLSDGYIYMKMLQKQKRVQLDESLLGLFITTFCLNFICWCLLALYVFSFSFHYTKLSQQLLKAKRHLFSNKWDAQTWNLLNAKEGWSWILMYVVWMSGQHIKHEIDNKQLNIIRTETRVKKPTQASSWLAELFHKNKQ